MAFFKGRTTEGPELARLATISADLNERQLLSKRRNCPNGQNGAQTRFLRFVALLGGLDGLALGCCERASESLGEPLRASVSLCEPL